MNQPADLAKRGKNGVPVLERAIEVLGFVERSEHGETIRDLTRHLNLPRSTVYRILNTLLAHDMVQRTETGAFVLGPRLLALAAKVRPGGAGYDLAAIALPFMQKLAEQTGEPNKISVRDGNQALVVAAVLGSHEYSPTPTVGSRYPLHAGAASKLILAHLPADDLAALLAQPLERYTSHTIVDPTRLRSELNRIRRDELARDEGEHHASVFAIAAPVYEAPGRFVAALSIPFLVDKDQPTRELLRAAVIESAAQISTAIAQR